MKLLATSKVVILIIGTTNVGPTNVGLYKHKTYKRRTVQTSDWYKRRTSTFIRKNVGLRRKKYI